MTRQGNYPPLINIGHLMRGERGPIPKWINKGDGVAHRFWRKIYYATPPWLGESGIEAIRKKYADRPPGYHVDHIVPLKSHLVCGLHVPWNLQHLPAGPNMSKSNTYWPDCPHENKELFNLNPEPHQLRLI